MAEMVTWLLIVVGSCTISAIIAGIVPVLTGFLFPMPFSMFRLTHQGHHLRNRTDHEMFDLYYPTDSRAYGG
jgi:hypothetical protein